MEKEVENEMLTENISYKDAKNRQDKKVDRIQKKIENEVQKTLMDAVTPQTITNDPISKFDSSEALEQYRIAFDEEFMRQIKSEILLEAKEKIKQNDLLVAFSQFGTKDKDPLSSSLSNISHKPQPK